MKALVVANWKMNPATFAEAKKLFDATRKTAERCAKSSLVVAPPAVYLRELARSYRGAKIPLALQNGHFEENGAHTGETSLAQGKDAGASYVLIGHAERRAMGETNEDTGKKVAAALAHKMTPILCIGEKERSHAGEHLEFVRAQLYAGLEASKTMLKRVVIAYEPVWAIGATQAMLPHDMHGMSIFIRKVLIDSFGVEDSVKIIYGGSVDDTNAVMMMREAEVRGFLVGRASLDAVAFSDLLAALEAA